MSAISNIRKNLNSTGSTIVVGFIVFVLVATFGGFIGNNNLGGNIIFSVNGEDVHAGEYSLEANRIASNFDELNDISEEELDNFTRSSIIFKKLFSQKAEEIGFGVSEERINDLIKQDLNFYSDGKFDVNIFRGLLSRLGMTTDEFRILTESNYNASALINFFNSTSFVTNEDAKNFITTSKQKRDIRFKKISLKEVADDQIVSSNEILDFYNNYQNNFYTLKKINVNSILISKDDFKNDVIISADEILEEREALIELNGNSSQTRISHIQLSYDETTKSKQFGIAETLIAELDSGSLSFEELVLRYSDDFGSKDNEGDLGFTDGTIFPDEFENELSNIELDGISKIIDLGSSFHLLKVTERNEFTVTDDDIISRLTSIKTEEEMQNILNEIDENLSNLTVSDISEIYDISYDIEKDLSVTDLLITYGNLDFVDDFERNNIFLNEVYGPYEIDQGYLIIEPTELSPSVLKPIDEVKGEIEQELKLSAAKTLLPSIVENYLTDLQKQENLENFVIYSEIDRETSLFPEEVSRTIFSIPSMTGPDSIASTFYLDDAYVIEILGVDDFNGIITLEEIEATKIGISQAMGEIQRDNLYQALRDTANIN
ncbi:MAG: hypothetical protein EVA47_03680 [Gammaproteobacteria bacterium]|nr:MAG: hypothetical protein EVA47_03680 [Gammaproteobacteria bacterium]